MKKLLIAVGALTLLSSRATAWEAKGNPDRFASIAVGYHKQSLSGIGSAQEQISFFSIPVAVPLDTSMERQSINVQYIFPANERVSLIFDWSHDTETFNYTGMTAGNINSNLMGDMDGSTVGATFKLYFNAKK